MVNRGSIENYSHSLFSIDEIHKIAVLDLRILNLDRNLGNILVQTKHPQCEIESCLTEPTSGKSCCRLVPIDHGLSIPDTLAINSYEVAWMSFEQANEPFSQTTMDYIDQINIIEDLKLLQSRLMFRPICLRNMRISGTLLKIGASLNLTLFQIG